MKYLLLVGLLFTLPAAHAFGPIKIGDSSADNCHQIPGVFGRYDMPIPTPGRCVNGDYVVVVSPPPVVPNITTDDSIELTALKLAAGWTGRPSDYFEENEKKHPGFIEFQIWMLKKTVEHPERLKELNEYNNVAYRAYMKLLEEQKQS